MDKKALASFKIKSFKSASPQSNDFIIVSFVNLISLYRLNANFYSIWFIRENGSDQYYRHNKGLLFDDRQKLILGQMEELESTMKRGIIDGV